VTSPEGKESSRAIASAVSSVGDIFVNIRDAWTAAEAVLNTESDAAQKASGNSEVGGGIKSVLANESVKSKLGAIGSSAQKTVVETSRALGLAIAKLASHLEASVKWRNALTDLTEGLAILLTVLTVAGTRAVEKLGTDKQLPGSNNP
jgi:hypothetical protein